MRLGSFARRLDAWGPALEQWPERERRAAEALLATSAEARALHGRARALDRALRDGLPQPDTAAVARLRSGVARRIARAPLPAPPTFFQRLTDALSPAVPAGCGALVAMASCALWLALAPPGAPAGDPLAPLQALPFTVEPL